MIHPDTNPAFFCDRMAGSLCKYLRFMGYDCASANDLPQGNPKEDTAILLISKEENRLILTQDAELAGRGGDNAILLQSSDLAKQIGQLIYGGYITPEIKLTRCSRCNTILQETTAHTEIEGSIPSDTPLMYCPLCNQVYWEGSHTRNMRNHLREMIENEWKE